MLKLETSLFLNYQLGKYIGQIEIFQNIRMLLEFYFSERFFFVFFMFLVRGIVDNTNDIIKRIVIPTSVQKVILDNSNSPNETVWYKYNFN